jgi:hypothetical protein
MAETIVTLSGDDKALLAALKRISGAQDGVDAGLRRIKKTSGEAGSAAKGSFSGLDGLLDKLKGKLDDSFEIDISSVTNAIPVIGGLSGAIGLATQAWHTYKDAQEAAVDSLVSMQNSDRRLIQVASSSQDLEKMQNEADTAASLYGVDRTVARNVRFSARSEGFDEDFMPLMAASNVIDPKSAASVAGQIPGLFQGTIGNMEAVSLALKGAMTSRLDFEQIGAALPSAAEGASIAKTSPEETVALASVLAARFKSGDVAGDRIKAFGTAVGLDERLTGQGIIAAFKEIQSMSSDDRSNFLGSGQELNAAYTMISQELSKIEALTSELAKERDSFRAGGGTLRDQMEIASGSASAEASRKIQAMDNRVEIAKERNLGETGVNVRVAELGTQAAIEDRKLSIGDRFAATYVGKPVAGLLAEAGADPKRAGKAATELSVRLGRMATPIGMARNIVESITMPFFGTGRGNVEVPSRKEGANPSTAADAYSPQAAKDMSRQTQVLEEIRDALNRRPKTIDERPVVTPNQVRQQAATRAGE